ncbi:MAG: hypothetical protein ACIAQZ_14875 [Sedimentisphaeraceae bacterium JB056]
MKCYSPNVYLPLRIRKNLPVEWSYVAIDGSVKKEVNYPPLPGCIIKDERIFYPRDLLPAVEKIYPKAIIPERLIIHEGETK